MDIKVFKNIAGEDMIGDVVSNEGTYYTIQNAANIVLQETEKGVRVAIAPVMPFSTGTINLYKHSIAIEATPADAMVEEYKRVYSPIVTPQQSIIMPK
jgi:hypothetical protein